MAADQTTTELKRLGFISSYGSAGLEAVTSSTPYARARNRRWLEPN
jgi:hypothetical protein